MGKEKKEPWFAEYACLKCKKRAIVIKGDPEWKPVGTLRTCGVCGDRLWLTCCM